MSYSDAATHVLVRFVEKCRLAGGPKAGYNLRRRSIEQGWRVSDAKAMDEGLADLVSQGILASNEAGDRYILTEQGVETLTAL